MRAIDKTKKSNVKCEHCENFMGEDTPTRCALSGEEKAYYNRCRRFDWKKNACYKT